MDPIRMGHPQNGRISRGDSKRSLTPSTKRKKPRRKKPRAYEKQYTAMVSNVNSIFFRLRHYTDLSLFLGLFGIFSSIVQRELYFQDEDWEVVANLIRLTTTMSTICLIYCVFQYYKADFELLGLNRKFLDQSRCWTPNKIISFAIECLILMIHEPPFFNTTYDVSLKDISTIEPEVVEVRNPWALIIILRLYLVPRVILHRYYTGGTKIVGMWHNFSFSIAFAIRNMLYTYPLLSMVPLFSTISMYGAYSMYVCERQGTQEFGFDTACWLLFITITGVGYGDVYPLTQCGRGVSVSASFCAILVTAVLVAAVHQKLTLLPYESRMVEFVERSKHYKGLANTASRCIALAFKNWQYRSSRKSRLECAYIQRQLIMAIYDFSKQRKNFAAYEKRYHANQLFRSMLEGIQDNLIDVAASTKQRDYRDLILWKHRTGREWVTIESESDDEPEIKEPVSKLNMIDEEVWPTQSCVCSCRLHCGCPCHTHSHIVPEDEDADQEEQEDGGLSKRNGGRQKQLENDLNTGRNDDAVLPLVLHHDKTNSDSNHITSSKQDKAQLLLLLKINKRLKQLDERMDSWEQKKPPVAGLLPTSEILSSLTVGTTIGAATETAPNIHNQRPREEELGSHQGDREQNLYRQQEKEQQQHHQHLQQSRRFIEEQRRIGRKGRQGRGRGANHDRNRTRGGGRGPGRGRNTDKHCQDRANNYYNQDDEEFGDKKGTDTYVGVNYSQNPAGRRYTIQRDMGSPDSVSVHQQRKQRNDDRSPDREPSQHSIERNNPHSLASSSSSAFTAPSVPGASLGVNAGGRIAARTELERLLDQPPSSVASIQSHPRRQLPDHHRSQPWPQSEPLSSRSPQQQEYQPDVYGDSDFSLRRLNMEDIELQDTAASQSNVSGARDRGRSDTVAGPPRGRTRSTPTTTTPESSPRYSAAIDKNKGNSPNMGWRGGQRNNRSSGDDRSSRVLGPRRRQSAMPRSRSRPSHSQSRHRHQRSQSQQLSPTFDSLSSNRQDQTDSPRPFNTQRQNSDNNGVRVGPDSRRGLPSSSFNRFTPPLPRSSSANNSGTSRGSRRYGGGSVSTDERALR